MLKKFIDSFVVVVSLVVFVTFVFVFVFDYAGGCGEVFTYADGSLHQGECLGRELLNQFLSEAFQ